MPSMPRQEHLRIYLLKEDIDPEAALNDEKNPTGYPLTGFPEESARLFLEGKPPRAPKWLDYLEPYAKADFKSLRTATSSALILLGAADRLFAVAFGQGRHLLDPNAHETDFGLKVVVNTVAYDQLKSVDAKTLDESTLHTRRNVSKDSAFAAFGLDISRDILRGVTGIPQDPELGTKLSGTESLGIWTRRPLPELPELLERLHTAYISNAYKEHFAFIDQMKIVKEREQVQALDSRLLNAIRGRDISNAHMAVPEVINEHERDIQGFRFSCMRKDEALMTDPSISTYLDSRADREINIELMKKQDRLEAIRSDDHEVAERWPVYKAIVFEVDEGANRFILSGGDWFQVSEDYREEVRQYVGDLNLFEELPDASEGMREDEYNRMAASHLGAACLDGRNVRFNRYDQMEVCDILTSDGCLIHVKKRGASSTLSHLFLQALNSAERLLEDEEFRTKARSVAAEVNAEFEDVLPSNRPHTRDYRVIFAVIVRNPPGEEPARNIPERLPFFSQVSLREAARRLSNFGYQVSVAQVAEQRSA